MEKKEKEKKVAGWFQKVIYIQILIDFCTHSSWAERLKNELITNTHNKKTIHC